MEAHRADATHQRHQCSCVVERGPQGPSKDITEAERDTPFQSISILPGLQQLNNPSHNEYTVELVGVGGVSLLVQDQRQWREEEEEACPIRVGLSQGYSWKELGLSVWGPGQANKTEEGKRELTLCGERVVEVFLGWAVLPIALKCSSLWGRGGTS